MVSSREAPARITKLCPTIFPWSGALTVVQHLQQSGYEAWFVGGCVRDLLLGETVHDIDIATNALPQQVEALFPRTVAVGKSFGVIVVILEEGQNVEVATFRHDGMYIDGRRPQSVTFGSVIDDVERRDFTINALLMSPADSLIIDYVGGIIDLEARCLRTVGEAHQRFQEDRLRILRGLRFSARYQLAIEPQTWQALCACSLTGLSAERLVQEWDKALSGPHSAHWFRLLVESGHIAALHPPGSTLDIENQRLISASLQRIQGAESLAVRQALWLRSHVESDVAMWLRILPGPRQRWERIHWLITHAPSDTVITWPKHRRRRLWQNPGAQDVLDFWRCCDQDQETVQKLMIEMDNERKLGSWKPLMTARDLLVLGYSPGIELGEALKALEDEQLEGLIVTKEEGEARARERLIASKRLQ